MSRDDGRFWDAGFNRLLGYGLASSLLAYTALLTAAIGPMGVVAALLTMIIVAPVATLLWASGGVLIALPLYILLRRIRVSDQHMMSVATGCGAVLVGGAWLTPAVMAQAGVVLLIGMTACGAASGALAGWAFARAGRAATGGQP